MWLKSELFKYKTAALVKAYLVVGVFQKARLKETNRFCYIIKALLVETFYYFYDNNTARSRNQAVRQFSMIYSHASRKRGAFLTTYIVQLPSKVESD